MTPQIQLLVLKCRRRFCICSTYGSDVLFVYQIRQLQTCKIRTYCAIKYAPEFHEYWHSNCGSNEGCLFDLGWYTQRSSDAYRFSRDHPLHCHCHYVSVQLRLHELPCLASLHLHQQEPLVFQ